MTPATRTGIVFILLSAFCYACLPIFANFAYDSGLRPFDVVTWRFIIAMPLVWLLLWRTGRAVIPPGYPVRAMLGLGLLLAAIASLAFIGLERVPASIYILFVYTYPTMVAVMSSLMGEPVTRQMWLALALTSFGVVLTIPGWSSGDIADAFGDLDALGLMIALANGFGVALHIVLTRHLMKGQTNSALATGLNISGALAVMILLIPLTQPAAPTNAHGWLSVFGLSFISTIGAMYFFIVGMGYIGASKSAIISLFEPVMVMAMSFVLLGETLLPLQLVGAGMIVVSPLILRMRRRVRVTV